MNRPHAELLYDVPVEYRERFALLLNDASVPMKQLTDEIEKYLTTVRSVGPYVALIDVDEAERIGERCVSLLQLASTSALPHAHTITQAAIRYFITEDDDDEVTGVLGFDDDVQIINAVCRALQRPDLVLPLTRRM